MGGFNNPVVGAVNLIRRAIRSPNYVAGSAGWTINQDGTVEFNSLGGTLQVNNFGIFFYVPNAQSGTLRMSITTADGTDPYGNQYKTGLFLNQSQLWATGDHSDTVKINPTGEVHPVVAFYSAGFGELARIMGREDLNRLVLQATLAGAAVEINAPFLATAGYQGSNTAPGAQPPFNVTGSFVDYLTASWTPPSLLCPPSETIAINVTLYGFNNNTATSTVSAGFRLKQGATTLISPVLGQTAVTCAPEGNAAGVGNNRFKAMQYIVGTDILSGRSGQTLTVVPAWHISSGSAATCNVQNASISAYPMVFTQPQSG